MTGAGAAMIIIKRVYQIGLAVCLLYLIGSLFVSEFATASSPPRPLLANCIVTTTADNGPGSFRACLSQLTSGNTITFNTSTFPLNNPQTIAPLTALPAITADNVTIDASNAGVILDGISLTGVVDGLAINGADGVDILGLQIQNFSKTGIRISNGASNNTIGGSNALFGNACDGACNVIVKNLNGGITMTGINTQGNTVIGNTIGTDSGGTQDEGNSDFGIEISGGAQSNIITGNLISGNLGSGGGHKWQHHHGQHG